MYIRLTHAHSPTGLSISPFYLPPLSHFLSYTLTPIYVWCSDDFCLWCSDHFCLGVVSLYSPTAGLSSPPSTMPSSLPNLVTPMMNGYTGLAPQANVHPLETLYTNGLPPYSTQSPTAADTLQQTFTGVQQYTGAVHYTSLFSNPDLDTSRSSPESVECDS